jgi:methionyl-tRNA formyltransferase
MRIALIGNVAFSKSALLKLIQLNESIVTVITKEHSSFNADHVNMVDVCRQYDLEYKTVTDVNDVNVLNYIRSKQPDIIFCFGWSQLIKKDLLNLSSMGVIGFHPALLPQNRGRHPIIWALVLGLTETGSTFFFIDEGADSGDILSQRKIKVDYTDDAAGLYAKITDTALDQIEEFLPGLKNNTFQRIKQDHSRANYWRKRVEKDGEIDWRMSSTFIYNLVRALTKPYVGAHFIYKGDQIKIWQVAEVKMDCYSNIEPGKIIEVATDKTFLVKTGKDCIRVLRHELPEQLREGQYL